ncbi:MAG: pirin family protein, partial [archaeon]|nr:pirin family protein [archaeon]
YILEGELSHEDDLGNIGTLTYPEVQRMSAGTGIRHAEFNPTNAPLKLFQMWVLPSQLGLPPSWEQKGFPDEGMKKNQWALICSPDGRKGSLTIHQDAYLYATRLGKGNTLSYSFRSPSRLAYIVIAEGKIDVEKQTLFPRDAARVKGVNELVFTATTDAHFLLWDLPGN